jgi:hypothetical protein
MARRFGMMLCVYVYLLATRFGTKGTNIAADVAAIILEFDELQNRM